MVGSFRLRHFRHKLVVITFSILATLVVAEIGFRAYQYTRLKNAQLESYLLIPHTLYQFDEKVGYRYRPNLHVEARWLDDSNRQQRQNHFSTDSQGHVTQWTRKKNPHAYRIAFIGDSLTACIHNDRPWPDLLERRLNSDSEIRAALKGREVQVLSYARDGIGVVQFPSIVRHEILPEKPDLLVTSFITADIYRKFVWRKTIKLPEATEDYSIVLNCATLPAELGNPDCLFAGVISRDFNSDLSPAVMKKIRKEIALNLAKKIHWFQPYPELLSVALGGRLETLLGRNPYRLGNMNIEDRGDSIRLSANALKEIREMIPHSRFILTPVYWEIVHQAVSKLAGEVMAEVPELEIVPLLTYLPAVKDRSEVNPWINHPYDMHFSNLGAEVYAKAVHTYLKKEILKEVKGSYFSQR